MEIIGIFFLCDLSEIHLNQIDPFNFQEQEDAFKAGALSVAALLHHKFVDERYQRSRELDPIVGVSFTGLFDFFVNAFGIDWLHWWQTGRKEGWNSPSIQQEIDHLGVIYAVPLREEFSQTTVLEFLSQAEFFRHREAEYLNWWRQIVFENVWNYCSSHNLKRPNRCTTTQPAGSKSLLTNASPGWHPPKSQRFIRRMTFDRNNPIALALRDYGYTIIPSPDDKDSDGKLLDDPLDPRCQTWLVEFPVATTWANLPGVEDIEIEKFSALAQMDFCMQVQKFYATHNVSSTIELREPEIEPLALRIYEAIQNDEGYISATILARFDDHQSFPRLPFEPIDKETYERLVREVEERRVSSDLDGLLAKYDEGVELGPLDSACTSQSCERR